MDDVLKIVVEEVALEGSEGRRQRAYGDCKCFVEEEGMIFNPIYFLCSMILGYIRLYT